MTEDERIDLARKLHAMTKEFDSISFRAALAVASRQEIVPVAAQIREIMMAVTQEDAEVILDFAQALRGRVKRQPKSAMAV